MQKAKVIAKQPPMPPADEAAAGSSIGFGRRGHGGESHAVQGAGGRGMTGEIRNPVKLPVDLNLAEEYFVRCLAEGEPCKIGNGKLPKKGIESGEDANVVRSEVIRFFAYGGNEDNPVLGPEIYLQGAWVSGDLDLMHASIPYALVFGDCHFAASVMMQYVECTGLYLSGSSLAKGLKADGLTTKGDVNLDSGFSAEGAVRVPGANIGGDLSCVGGKFNNPDEYALIANGLVTKGSVYLSEGFFAKSEVRLLNANIGGDLDCTGGEFSNPGGNALFADKLTAKGDVNLSASFSAEGEVRLLGVNIGGDLDCTGGGFNNVDGYALSADKLTAKGNVDLNSGFSAKGEVRLLGANIGGDLGCEGGKFHNSGGNALSADSLTTKGSVNLRNGFFAEGGVRLLGASIGGNLDCEGGKFHNPGRMALNIVNGNISDILHWWGITCEGDVNLAYAKTDVLADAPDSWKSCKVVLEGFTYNRFAKPRDVQSRIDWLAKRPNKMRFSPLPYEQAAKVLFGMGHIGDAREILLKKERLQTADGKMPWLQRVGRRLWDVFAGYGYRLRYTAAWMAFFIVVGAVIFDAADARRRIVPTQVIVQANPDYGYAVKSHGTRPTDVVPEIFPGYAEFTPLAYSLDVFIPFFILQQESAWLPDSGDSDNVWKPSILLALAILALAIFAFLAEWIARRCEGPRGRACAYAGILGVFFAICCYFSNWLFGDWWWLTVWYWLEIIAGWILTSLFLLSVTGLLRPRQSSGERD